MAPQNNDDDKTTDPQQQQEVEEDEDEVYEMLQTSASLLDKASASHNERMMHSFGGSMDLEFTLDQDDSDDDEPSSEETK